MKCTEKVYGTEKGYGETEKVDILDLAVVITILILTFIGGCLPYLLIILGRGIAVRLIMTSKKGQLGTGSYDTEIQKYNSIVLLNNLRY